MNRINALDRIMLLLVIIGAINWGLVGLFGFDLVAEIFGGQDALLSRVVYTLVGLAGLYSIILLFKDTKGTHRHEVDHVQSSPLQHR